jgi:hypothetical protein
VLKVLAACFLISAEPVSTHWIESRQARQQVYGLPSSEMNLYWHSVPDPNLAFEPEPARGQQEFFYAAQV